RPSIQPSSRSRCTKAATRLLSIEGSAPKNPMVGSFPACCARAASGHAAAAPPSSVMNSRLLPRNSIRKRFGINDLPVSSILVRSAHGNSFDHLVGAGKQRRWDFEAERLCRLAVDDQIEFAGLHHRQVGGLGALQDAGGIRANLTVHVFKARSVGHQSPDFGECTTCVARWNRMAHCMIANWTLRLVKKGSGATKRASVPARERGKSLIDL